MARGWRLVAVLFGAMALVLGLPGGAPASAQSSRDPQSAALLLSPGEFVWFPETARASYGYAAPVSVVVSISAQRAYVYRGTTLLGVSTVSTGKPGKETPVGDFTILQKKVFHRSNLYSNAPMPFMQRLTWTGIALHAGQLPGYPASHGCIRLPREFARQLYDLTAMGGSVSVIDGDVEFAPYVPAEPAPMLRVDVASLGGAYYDVVTVGTPTIVSPLLSPEASAVFIR